MSTIEEKMERLAYLKKFAGVPSYDRQAAAIMQQLEDDENVTPDELSEMLENIGELDDKVEAAKDAVEAAENALALVPKPLGLNEIVTWSLDPANGDDANSGQLGSPMKTFAAMAAKMDGSAPNFVWVENEWTLEDRVEFRQKEVNCYIRARVAGTKMTFKGAGGISSGRGGYLEYVHFEQIFERSSPQPVMRLDNGFATVRYTLCHLALSPNDVGGGQMINRGSVNIEFIGTTRAPELEGLLMAFSDAPIYPAPFALHSF